MYVHAEIYIDESALEDWLMENGEDSWDGSDVDVLTDFVNDNQPMTMDVVKVL